jgi:hypothetical protein
MNFVMIWNCYLFKDTTHNLLLIFPTFKIFIFIFKMIKKKKKSCIKIIILKTDNNLQNILLESSFAWKKYFWAKGHKILV